ncbi:restriction endonuclease subunit S [Neobacillus niacini]|uniref:restriction endonuclease subunit S n=1 Tax=Neobacillus niacini TaxID=86668 RepID=UPI002FFFCB98
MNAQDLKYSILQLAIQGKLVEQREEEEGTAEELYQQIQGEKKKLIDEGKIKKTKALPEITEDEIPFGVPESWKWVRLSEIIDVRDGTHDTPKYVIEGVPLVTSKNLKNGEIDFDNVKLISLEDSEKINQRSGVDDGDILFAMIGSIGNPVLVKKSRDFSIKNMALFKVINRSLFKMEYLLYFLQLEQEFMKKKATGAVQSFVSLSFLRSYLVPLPPTEEQKRIVAKIEELLPYVEKYDKAYSEVEELNKKFPEDMEKSILQYAIQGNIVEQREEEGTAEELYQQIQEEKKKLFEIGEIKKFKKLPEITEDEAPFDIPDSWKWVRLGDISLNIGDIDHKMPPTVKEGYPYVSPLNFTKNSIDYDGAKKIGQKDFEHLSKKIKPERNDIIFPRYGTIGVIRMVDTDREFLVSYSCCTIKNIDRYIYPQYVFYTLKSGMIKKEINRYINKTTQPNVGLESIKKFMFPLPPLEEQKRIVEKIEELLPFTEQLVK